MDRRVEDLLAQLGIDGETPEAADMRALVSLAQRAMRAMLGMKKLDLAEVQAAADEA